MLGEAVPDGLAPSNPISSLDVAISRFYSPMVEYNTVQSRNNTTFQRFCCIGATEIYHHWTGRTAPAMI